MRYNTSIVKKCQDYLRWKHKKQGLKGEEMSMKKEVMVDMTSGRIAPQILRFAMPVLLGLVFQRIYNFADSYIVGHFLGDNALAAVRCRYVSGIFVDHRSDDGCNGCYVTVLWRKGRG